MFALHSRVQIYLAFGLALLYSSSGACANITEELGPLLSPGADIVFPGSAEFLAAIDRDNRQDPPIYRVVVEVATERDVQETVST